MDASANSQCVDGQHHIYDSSAKQFVNVGPCESVQDHPEAAEPTSQQQVVGAAQNAVDMLRRKPASAVGSPEDAQALSDGASSSGFKYLQNPFKGQ